jgi:hypothetical protein
MADIRVNSTGKPFWRIDDGVAQLLMEAFPESFSRVEKPAPPAQSITAVTHALGSTPTGLAAILRRTTRSTTYVAGSREQIRRDYPDCPASILDAWDNVNDSEKVQPPKG